MPHAFATRYTGWLQRICGFLLLLPGGCFVLGPTPAMTGVPVTPLERAAFELQAGAVPGYYLSETVQQDPQSTTMPELLGVLEPDDLIGVPGVFAGARYAGESDSGATLEPLLGYRSFLDEGKRFGIVATGFLAYMSASHDEASLSALRGGLDAGVDANVSGSSRYLELHVNLGAQLMGLSADGRYCLDSNGEYGQTCNDPQQARVSAALSGIYPSVHCGLSLDFARHLKIAFHGARLGFDLAGGTMPTIIGGTQRGVELYGNGGISLTLGVGASD